MPRVARNETAYHSLRATVGWPPLDGHRDYPDPSRSGQLRLLRNSCSLLVDENHLGLLLREGEPLLVTDKTSSGVEQVPLWFMELALHNPLMTVLTTDLTNVASRASRENHRR
jgi:hypothetical protein